MMKQGRLAPFYYRPQIPGRICLGNRDIFEAYSVKLRNPKYSQVCSETHHDEKQLKASALPGWAEQAGDRGGPLDQSIASKAHESKPLQKSYKRSLECHYVKEDSVHSFYLTMATPLTITVILQCSKSKQIR